MKEKVNGFNDHLHKCTFLACLMSANKLFMKKTSMCFLEISKSSDLSLFLIK